MSVWTISVASATRENPFRESDEVTVLTDSAAGGSTVYYQWTTAGHTKTEVGVWAYGFEPNLEKYYLEGTPGIIKNTSVFKIILGLLQNPQQ